MALHVVLLRRLLGIVRKEDFETFLLNSKIVEIQFDGHWPLKHPNFVIIDDFGH
jgi:hypothetical protein